MAIKKLVLAAAAIRFIDWLDLFHFHPPLCIILEHSSGAAQQKGDNYDADERTGDRMSDEPRIELQNHDERKHGDNCEATMAENEKREDTRNSSENNGEHNSDCGNERRVLKVLLRSKIIGEDTGFARPVIEEVLNPREESGKKVDDRIGDRSVARVLNALVRIVVERPTVFFRVIHGA